MSLFPVLSHQDERTDEGGGHQGGLWPQDLQTGESCEVNGLKFLLNNLFVMGNRVKSLPSCGQLMWWWKSGTIREFAQINHPKWAMSEISIWYLKHSKYHIVNQKMTTFEMFMKNEAACERLLRFCISGLAEILMKNTKYSNCQIAWFFLEQSQCILYIHCTHRRRTMF